jgi:(R)-citramalate synthase
MMLCKIKVSWPFSIKNTSFIELMDTTLRDGEQTDGVSFPIGEKLSIAKKLLLDVRVDRIEISSAKSSFGEQQSCKKIFDWAKKNKLLYNVEVLGFVDNDSVNWIFDAGGRVINLLCKGSKKHCLGQLKKTPKQHFSDIVNVISYAHKKGFVVNAYLEDFSNGVKKGSYVFDLINVLNKNNVKRIMLADTLGVFSPNTVEQYLPSIIKKFPNQHFDFHAHNDYGLAVANSLQALNCGVKGVHCTVNGLGERTGNTPLEEIVPAIKDFTVFKTRVVEKKLKSVSRLVELFSKYRVSKNKPIVGANVFTQTAGIHADGDKKGNLYVSKLSPKRFGRTTKYALGKLSGKSSIIMALKEFGIVLDDKQLKTILQKVIFLGDKKEYVSKEDLLFLVDELQKNNVSKKFDIIGYEISSFKKKKPFAKILIEFDKKEFSFSASGCGGYDAFVNAIKKFSKKNNFSFPKLIDYEVRIPIGGRTDALVETRIVWKHKKNVLETIGVSTDQTGAAIKATIKMINLVLKLN